jgi:hypothetical protein
VTGIFLPTRSTAIAAIENCGTDGGAISMGRE